MNEMNTLAVDFGLEMRKLVESRFLLTPVVIALPILDEFAEVIRRGTRIPTAPIDLAGPPSVTQPPVEVS